MTLHHVASPTPIYMTKLDFFSLFVRFVSERSNEKKKKKTAVKLKNAAIYRTIALTALFFMKKLNMFSHLIVFSCVWQIKAVIYYLKYSI